MTWVLIGWCALILIWAIAGGDSANDDCRADAVSQLERDACDAGTGIGVAIVLLIGFVGFLFFGLIWLMTRTRSRDCPVCGTGVKKGNTVCPKCGHDFATGVQTGSPTPPPPTQTPAGWYPDPESSGSQRYWDGNGWTEHRAPLGPSE